MEYLNVFPIDYLYNYIDITDITDSFLTAKSCSY